jgi:hypothetical protein
MKLGKIKEHLKPYSIVGRRKTTVNHAFASALAPCDPFDAERLAKAMASLEQSDHSRLTCVYCDKVAETWDHLVGLVKASEFFGYGHQVGNLVPCCRACNSSKGNRDWRDYLRSAIADNELRSKKELMLERYIQDFAIQVDLAAAAAIQPELWRRYDEIKKRILDLMSEADGIAEQLRLKVKASS